MSKDAVLNDHVFRGVFNASPIGIVIENLEGQPLFVNPAFCSFLGFTEEELCGKHCVDFSPAEDAEKDWILFQRLRAGQIDNYQLNKRYFRKDGSLVWGRLTLSLLKEKPSPLVIARVEDITDKRTAEEALRTSEERLRLAQTAARMGTFEWDIQSGLSTWTPELEGIYGLAPGSFGGKQADFERLVHPDDREAVRNLIQRSFDTREPTRGEWRVIWPDGTEHWIAGRWRVFMSESGIPLRMIGVNIDATERKLAEQALVQANCTLKKQACILQSREELLSIFVKNVPAAVAMLDRDMRYLQISDRWRTEYLPGREQILGQSHYEIFPDMPERWKEVHRRALEGETLRAEEDQWEGEDGRRHWARWEVRPWNGPDGEVGGILIFAENITRRKEMEEAISGMSRKLIEAQEQERSRIARELHDDVNQQLALLAVDLDKWAQSNPGADHSYLQEAMTRISSISQDLQNLSHQLHSSKLEYLGLVVAVRSFCKEISEKNNTSVDFRSQGVSQSLPREVSLSLFRILQQALHNAVQHSGASRIEVRLWEQSNEVHLEVKDLGSGFHLPVALQGAGLGLTSMQERARLVGGVITIDSRPMGGTKIHVRVPFASQKASEQAIA